MINKVAIRFAASSLVIAGTMVGCKPAAEMYRPAYASDKAAKADADAAQARHEAQVAFARGSLTEAVASAERAVELSPRDAGYRMLLAELYLKSGRFNAAETAFGDVLTLNPGNNRAAMNLALVEIALGKSAAALAQLDALQGSASPSDLGLAYALAGKPERGIALLEPAARAEGADGRVRQNLALAYALSGDWRKARVTAAQDVSPAELDARMSQWATFTSPHGSYDQVATLLGVHPVQDPGQPVRLALAPEAPTGTAYAEAQGLAVPAAGPQAAPVETASVTIPIDTVPVAAPAEAPQATLAVAPVEPAPEPALQAQYAEAAQSLFTAPPAPVKASLPIADKPIPAFEPHRSRPAGIGRYVVQIGAFSSPNNVERAWSLAEARFGLTGAHQPVSTTIDMGSATLHRLALGGFASRDDAVEFCRSIIKARKGACFVRAVAGDAPIQWASRDMRKA